jgi:hypothetical protein
MRSSTPKISHPSRKLPCNGLFGEVIFPSWHTPPFSKYMRSPVRSPTATRLAAVDDPTRESVGGLAILAVGRLSIEKKARQ